MAKDTGLEMLQTSANVFGMVFEQNIKKLIRCQAAQSWLYDEEAGFYAGWSQDKTAGGKRYLTEK